MQTRNPALHWCSAHLAAVLLVELMASVSPGALPEAVVCEVGGQALLPCMWRQRLAAASPHVEWVSRIPHATVYERWGARTWSAPEYAGRVGVPEEPLLAGNCSLLLRDAQLLDGGVYDSYGIWGDGRIANRVLMHSVRLSVHDHKLQRSVGVGENIVVELHTPRALRMVFQNRSGSGWDLLWLRGAQVSPRVQMSQGRDEVVLAGATPEDQGFYKVLDEQGLAVSTLQLSVHELPWATERLQDTSPAQSAAAGPRPAAYISLLWLCALASSVALP